MVKLVIVESPAKCKKIESFLGKGYKCIASFGHIRDIADGLKGINIKGNFEPSYRILPSKAKYIKPLKAAVRKADEIILATDDDREGEAIAWHLCDTFNLPVTSTKRIIFHEITKSAVQKAVKNPTIIDMNKVYAQQARQVLDCLVGFTISPILWANISRKGGLSAGRCQTPALRLIYDNYKEIESTPGRIAYDTTGDFAIASNNLDFKLNYHHENEIKMEEFLEKSVEWEHVYSSNTPVSKEKKQPLPFTTSTLQQKSSNILHFSPKRTMTTAQKLYEQGYITYMRTDSRTYSKDFITSAKSFIESKWSEDYVNDNILCDPTENVCSFTITRFQDENGDFYDFTLPQKYDVGMYPYEYTQCLGMRTRQFELNAEPRIEVTKDLNTPQLIAEAELYQRKTPFILERKIR